MKKILPYFLGAFSGFFLFSSWIIPLPGFFVLIAFLPLLYAENLISNLPSKYKNLHVFLLGFICFFTENLSALWGLQKLLSSWAILFFIYNSLLSSLVFLLFSVVKRRLGCIWGFAAWIAFTVCFELLILNINFSFPCLLTGNTIFGSGNPALVQWYEYTGVLGGSVWILLCNVLLFLLLKSYLAEKSLKGNRKLWVASAVCVLFPLAFSVFKYYTYSEKNDPVEFVVVQPNIDPYREKFVRSNEEQLDDMIMLAKQAVTSNTDYVVFPETALIGNIWLNNIGGNNMILKVRDSLLINFQNAKVIAGADMMQYYIVNDGKAPTPWAKKVEERVYYDFFNVALQIDAQGEAEVYKKSKLVLGTEYIPWVQRFPELEKWVINLGGSAQSRGRQDKPSLLTSESASIATIICFESIYGEYVSRFVKLGGEIICVISNDGWWEGTPIPMQHFRYAQLRAIENRRSVVRCANTGISGFIDQRGNITEKSEWWEAASLRLEVNKNTELTFYSRYGDYIGWICAVLSLIIIFYYLYRIIFR